MTKKLNQAIFEKFLEAIFRTKIAKIWLHSLTLSKSNLITFCQLDIFDLMVYSGSKWSQGSYSHSHSKRCPSMSLASLPVMTRVPETPLVNSIEPTSLISRDVDDSGRFCRVIAGKNVRGISQRGHLLSKCP